MGQQRNGVILEGKTIGEFVDACKLDADASQKLKKWLASPAGGYDLGEEPDEGFLLMSYEDLQEAGLPREGWQSCKVRMALQVLACEPAAGRGTPPPTGQLKQIVFHVTQSVRPEHPTSTWQLDRREERRAKQEYQPVQADSIPRGSLYPWGEDPDARVLTDHYAELMQRIHAEAAPGDERESSALDPELPLRQQVALPDSREETYRSFLREWARIYWRWREGWYIAGGELFWHGLAHIALLGCAGSGKTALLAGLLGWLREHFSEQKREHEEFVAEAMYGHGPGDLPDYKKAALRDFLAGVRRTAESPHLLAMLRVQDDDLRTTRWERELEVKAINGVAARLLYACLTPVGDLAPGSSGPGSYREFLQGMPKKLRGRLTCRAVIDFVRRALKVPAKVPLLLMLLVDDGDAAQGNFPDYGPEQEGFTWLKELLSAVIFESGTPSGHGNALVVPVTACTEPKAVDLRYTYLRDCAARSVDLSVQPLTADETQAVVLDLARRAARNAHGPELHALPDDAAKTWTKVHDCLGGRPQLLAEFLESLACSGQTPGADWSKGLAEKITGLQEELARETLRVTYARGIEEGGWLSLSEQRRAAACSPSSVKER